MMMGPVMVATTTVMAMTGLKLLTPAILTTMMMALR